MTFVAAPPVNLAQLLKQKQLDAIFLEDIIKDKLVADGGATLLTTDYQLFGSFGYASYLFTDRFIAQNPNTVRKFVDGTARAIEWARNTPHDEVVARLKKIVAQRHRNEEPRSSTTGSPRGRRQGRPDQRRRFHDLYRLVRQKRRAQARSGKARKIYSNQFNPFNQSVAAH